MLLAKVAKTFYLKAMKIHCSIGAAFQLSIICLQMLGRRDYQPTVERKIIFFDNFILILCFYLI